MGEKIEKLPRQAVHLSKYLLTLSLPPQFERLAALDACPEAKCHKHAGDSARCSKPLAKEALKGHLPRFRAQYNCITANRASSPTANKVSPKPPLISERSLSAPQTPDHTRGVCVDLAYIYINNPSSNPRSSTDLPFISRLVARFNNSTK